MDVAKLLMEKHNDVLAVATKHGVSNVRVFGSIARGEADEKSDVDLLISIEPEFSLMDHVRLEAELNELLGCKVDVVSDGGLKRPRFRQRVLRDAIPL